MVLSLIVAMSPDCLTCRLSSATLQRARGKLHVAGNSQARAFT